MRYRLFIFCILLVSCKKSDDNALPEKKVGSVSLNISYSADSQPLLWNEMIYKNQAGEQYSVNRLQYYLSGFRFYKDKALIQEIDSVFFVDARRSETNMLLLPAVIIGLYDSISFCIGVVPRKNKIDGLPATIDNVNMVWPDAMGGGYHFLKFEGHWKDSLATPGFAMHLGSDGLQGFAGISNWSTVLPGKITEVKMSMNINEWFRNPNTFSFAKDGVYIMGNGPLMQKIMQNGGDVFTSL
jgi:hypothetical protein